LLAVLTLSAMVLLWQAHWPWLFANAVSMALLAVAYPGMQQGRPQPKWMQLIYREARWWLYDDQGREMEYASARIRYQVGVLMCLELRSKTHKQRLFLFNDQLSAEERRALYLLQLLC
jgi:hypothetical protein